MSEVTYNRPKIAAAVVLYNPLAGLSENLASWIDSVDRIFAIDNSEGEVSATVLELAEYEKIHIEHNYENRGVASALNRGAECAIAAGYEWLLTMDQDSCATPQMIDNMLTYLQHSSSDRIGIISPFHRTKSKHYHPETEFQQVMTPMTSGSLINLAAYRQTGPFRDDFFIDFVDNEYALRLRRLGFEVVRCNRAVLDHEVGDTCKYGPFIATNHSPLRRYYKTRNRLAVFAEYFNAFPGHCLFDLVRLTKEIASIILFEADKFAKLGMMLRGVTDYLRGRFGRYDG